MPGSELIPFGQPADEDVTRFLTDFEKRLLIARTRAEERTKRRAERGTATRIPKLTRRNAIRYIGQVSRAVQLQHISPKQASAMLYAAQLLIAASRLDGPDDPPAPATTPHKRRMLEGS